MLPGASAPPRFRGCTWSITYPGHAPDFLPVEGQGCECLKSSFAFMLRAVFPWEFFEECPECREDACEPPELWPLASQVPENAIATAQAIAARIFTGYPLTA